MHLILMDFSVAVHTNLRSLEKQSAILTMEDRELCKMYQSFTTTNHTAMFHTMTYLYCHPIKLNVGSDTTKPVFNGLKIYNQVWPSLEHAVLERSAQHRLVIPSG